MLEFHIPIPILNKWALICLSFGQISWLTDCLGADWLTSWQTDRQTDWLTNGLTEWLNSWLILRLTFLWFSSSPVCPSIHGFIQFVFVRRYHPFSVCLFRQFACFFVHAVLRPSGPSIAHFLFVCFLCLFVDWFVRLFVRFHSFSRPFARYFIYLILRSFIRSFVCSSSLFFCPFINSFFQHWETVHVDQLVDGDVKEHTHEKQRKKAR